MEHKHSVYDTDTHFVIAKDTREIKLESTTAPVIVQHDHNSERFSFELPRYIDGHDMTLCNEVQVHYLNIDSSTKDTTKGVYTVGDIGLLEGDANTAVCSWLISENATKFAGKLNFMIRFACLADDGTVLYRWNTGIYTELTVVSGYDNGEAVTEDFPDILAQWKAELFGIGDTEEQRLLDVSAEQQAAIAAKGEAVNASIPEDYTATHNMAATALQSMANAIKGNLSGELVLANDVSCVEHNVSVRVRGKNLFDDLLNFTKEQSTDYTYENEVLTVNGYYVNKRIAVDCGKTYTFSFKSTRTGETGGGTYIIARSSDGQTSQAMYASSNKLSATFSFTVPDFAAFIIVFFYGGGDSLENRGTAVYTDIQLEESETATEYTPYVAPQNITLARCGKNLIDLTASCNGFFVKNADGSYTFTMGKIAGERFSRKMPFYLPAGVPFFFSMELTEYTVTNETLYMILSHADGTESYPGIGLSEGRREITFSKPVTHIQFYLQGSEVAGAYISFCKFQIEAGNGFTGYEPYKGAEFMPNADGTASGITSLSPNMTVLTDTAGAIVECEYNVDTKAYIDKKIAELMAK